MERPNLHLSNAWLEQLACRQCGETLSLESSDSGEAFSCSVCNADYKLEDRILGYGNLDGFYETHGFVSTGRVFKSGLADNVLLYFARNRFLWDIQHRVEPGASVIELGCAGGSAQLASQYDMLGVDVSTQSTVAASRTYDSVIRASIDEMPIRGDSADAIVSSCVLEHLDDAAAESSFAEMARVLKPGGLMFHYFDLDCDGPFTSWAKSHDWWKVVQDDRRGHIGLRRFSDWEQIFERHGFSVADTRMLNKTWFQDPSVWASLDDEAVNGMAKRLGRFGNRIHKLGAISSIGTTLYQDVVERWFPDRWAAKAIVVLRKAG